jgi:hypothetical protein
MKYVNTLSAILEKNLKKSATARSLELRGTAYVKGKGEKLRISRNGMTETDIVNGLPAPK